MKHTPNRFIWGFKQRTLTAIISNSDTAVIIHYTLYYIVYYTLYWLCCFLFTVNSKWNIDHIIVGSCRMFFSLTPITFGPVRKNFTFVYQLNASTVVMIIVKLLQISYLYLLKITMWNVLSSTLVYGQIPQNLMEFPTASAVLCVLC